MDNPYQNENEELLEELRRQHKAQMKKYCDMAEKLNKDVAEGEGEEAKEGLNDE